MAKEDTSMQGWDNATLIAQKDLTGDSAIFRIEADAPLFEFLAGQYTTIGLPADAARIDTVEPDEIANGNPRKRIVRAYSIASSSEVRRYVELYVTLVKSGSLTPSPWLQNPSGKHRKKKAGRQETMVKLS